MRQRPLIIGTLSFASLLIVNCGGRTALDSSQAFANGGATGGMSAAVTSSAVTAGGTKASMPATTTGPLLLGGSPQTGGASGVAQSMFTGGRTNAGGSSMVSGGFTGLGGSIAASGGQMTTAACTNRPAKSERESLIDDLESGTGRLPSTDKRVGVWYSFNSDDGLDLQVPPTTTPGIPIPPSPIPAIESPFASCGSKFAMHTYGGNYHWAGIGFDLNFDGTTYGTYDASAFDGITWFAAGSTLGDFRVRVSTRSTTSTEYGGTCTLDESHPSSGGNEGCQPHATGASLDEDFAQHWVPFSKLEPFYRDPEIASPVFEPKLLTNIQFYTGGVFDFWIDDVAFYRGRPGCCALGPPECNGVISFSSASLKARLGSGDLTCADVCFLEGLDASQTIAPDAPQDLQGAQCLVGLRALVANNASLVDARAIADLKWLDYLSLASNRLTDLGPLAGLKRLRTLALGHNAIENLQPLARLTGLQNLILRGNSFTDVSPLSSLTTLETLDVSDNRVTDVAAISKLTKLTGLELKNNSIESLAGFGNLPKVYTLDLSNNQIRDLANFGNMAALTTLNLSSNQLTTVAFGDLPNLQSLDLSQNKVTDLTRFGQLPALTSVDLSNNEVSNLKNAGGLPKLETLDLSFNRVSDVTGIGSIDALKTLILSHNQVHDLSTLAELLQLPSLRYLRLDGNPISTLQALPMLTQLTGLDLSSTGISDITPLGQLPSLSGLYLANNTIHDVSVLSGLDELAYLDLQGNQITDVTPFLTFTWAPPYSGDRYTTYATLNLKDNPINCSQQATNLKILQSYHVSVLSDCVIAQ
jgi:Leucine-rich repeat (LRR) protein